MNSIGGDEPVSDLNLPRTRRFVAEYCRWVGRKVARVVEIQTLAHVRVQVVGLDLATQVVRVREQQRAAVAAVSGLNCHLLTLDITQPLQCQQIIQSV